MSLNFEGHLTAVRAAQLNRANSSRCYNLNKTDSTNQTINSRNKRTAQRDSPIYYKALNKAQSGGTTESRYAIKLHIII
jgi:hypothetical protein